ncbi:type I glyceraldehyde-3-phosphate dehydrogenase [Candidatus Falkowbacteria bacterium HGW-Falkowbacteria-2]|uniref:Glyceraldehyde-3-phosphate dehydrogenase n=1 Tax=Candidatus Falkowbacteria bacterium HGW-Falkowbacteria-2 TaxID=2013769 RepID=A0A2N2E1G5_9BACT|nr:MAG: type I glyceraldehyde-3-phosphate dehydrogenase [Candidatus Falkowbacteria bacterium HGW-Falkowbacteria-2]
MSLNVAINGFGRIGRATFKIILDKHPDLRVVAINDLTDNATLAHLLQRDSCYGLYQKQVKGDARGLTVDGKHYAIFSEKDPSLLPWKELGVDVVIECTGRFRDKESVSAHLQAGAKKVIISAPAKGAGIKTIVLGVNEKTLKTSDDIISNASCTTNCLAPAMSVLKEKFGVKKAMMTTIHSYTADQNLVDGPHKDLRRARAAALNMVPTTTGAAAAVALTMPSLKDKFDGLAVRVPTPVASLCDIVLVTSKNVTVEKVNAAFKAAAKGKLKGILEASDEELVSSDIIGNANSSVIDLKSTKVVAGDLLKVVAWYDNEWAYSARLAALASVLKKYIK